MSTSFYLLSLPHELLILILDFLDTSSIFSLSRTCKRYVFHISVNMDILAIHNDAIRNKHTNLFKWLVVDMTLSPLNNNNYYYYQAANFGCLEILKYLHKHENGYCWNEYVCDRAAANGHLEVIKYLHENGCPWNEYSCYRAAGNGHLEILKYLHENGCPWDSDSCYAAVDNDHLEILKYLHENGCPWDKNAFYSAAENGHLEILKYMYENGWS